MKKVFLFMMIFSFFVNDNFAQVTLKGMKDDTTPCTTLVAGNMIMAIDTTPGRQVADNYKTWENGDVILVKFMNNVGSQNLRNRIMSFAKEWELYGNITLKFVPDNTPQTNIRVRLGGKADEIGHNSTVGVDCNTVPQYLQTLNLDTSDFIDYKAYEEQLKVAGTFYTYLKNKGVDFNNYTYAQLYNDIRAYPDPNRLWNYSAMGRTSRHEFGHALGLLHEQSYPGAIKWNVDTVYKYYKQFKWDEKTVDQQVFETSDLFFTNGTNYDPKSVMHYAVYAWQTLNGYSVERSTTISEGDKKIMAALYPKDKSISTLAVPKIEITNFNKLEVKVDEARKGLAIYPSFDVKTSPLLGRVYILARLTTEDGKYYIPTTNLIYSWNKMAATYLKMNLLPSSNVSYNKSATKNLELFFPFKDMPELNGQKVKVEFTVYLDDLANNKMNRLVVYALSAPLEGLK